ncbi:BrnT family toxin [Phragmitibacter flavus]|uniref:BrnT family toxin n=1 Tax=Phragmitibacter flavus TaxID=2576071 RepID=A0A5R8K9M0_9BACT|nr:BrnT family toxin [Phragmitibacter flavus]TLD68209.1 BrnT family toxin [Phragmitibacter flavus]
MNDLSFEWDPVKAARNAAKHGVTFEEARAVFLDEHALVIPDPDHSQQEERFIIMGQGAKLRVLVVVHCFRQKGSSIRIVSARRARTKEQKPYWENLK